MRLLRALSSAAALPLLFMPSIADAQLSADKNAPASQRPSISAAPNGVPLVDIAAPNKGGLSHNKYQDFNIGAPGLIWNNHNAEAGVSKLGGAVPGNANLRKSGPAGVILNEVTGGGRSALSGPGEVFGGMADVVIANPNGITCNGCGFINTPRATLTTGIPQIGGDGRLTGFDVRGGDVTFGEKGANLQSGLGSVDIFDIISRRVTFNGSVAAHDIGIAAGTGKYDYASREMKELADIAGKPEYAIDGSALGALQADRIKIVATEKGVGVRMRSDMAAHVGQVSLSADGKITLNNLSGKGGVSVRSKRGAVKAARITSKKNIDIKAQQDIALRYLGADGAISAAAGGKVSAQENIVSGGNLSLASGDKITAAQVAAGGSLEAKAEAGIAVQSAIANGKAELSSAHDDITASGGIKAGDNLQIKADSGSVNAGELVSFGDMNILAGQNLAASGNMIAQGSLTAQAGQNIAVSGAMISGMNIAASQASAANGGSAVMNKGKALNIRGGGAVSAGSLISGGDMSVQGGAGISYKDLVSYNSAYLRAERGDISIDSRTAAAGNISLTASNLDLSDNRAKVQAGGTVSLNADSVNLSGSRLTYGGLKVNTSGALNISNAEIAAVTSGAVTAGDIALTAQSLTADENTAILARRNLDIAAGALDNSGQLAAGNNLRLNISGGASASGDGVNRASGLIYASGNAAILTDGSFTNEFGAIIAQANLLFAGADGVSRSSALVNHAGLIQAGNALTVKTQSLTNEADATPYITTEHAEQKFSFDKPAHYEKLGEFKEKYSNNLFYDDKKKAWGAGKVTVKHRPDRQSTWKVGDKLYNSKEDAYSTITLPDGSHYRADNWVYEKSFNEGRTQKYDLNNKASMSVLTDTDTIQNKPAAAGLIQAGGDVHIEAGTIDNRYSAIEAGGNALITVGTLNNLGVTAYKVTADKCGAGSDCYAYNADGSRNKAGDILRGAAGNIQRAAIDDASSLIRAGGTLDISAGTLRNTAAAGSLAGNAAFEKKPVSGDPLSALSGMTAGGALFTPAIAVDGGRAPKPQSGGFGGTVPGQNFVYETRARFVDVGKFYGSAYFLKHIGYQPEHMLFLGDAYFENQLIDKQLRDLTGEGLRKGAFIPGAGAAEQMKALLDNGAEYMQAHGLAFGDGLTAEQAAALDKSIVLYVRQEANGREVFAPVLYVSPKDRTNQSAAGAKIAGGDVRINAGGAATAGDLINSGLVESGHDMEIRAGNIFAQGGGFASEGSLLLASAGDIKLSGASAQIGKDGINAVLPAASVSAKGNARLEAGHDLSLSGAGVYTGGATAAGGDLSLHAGNDVRIGSEASVNEYHANGEAGGATTARTVSQTGSQLVSGGSQSIAAGGDIAVSGSDMLAGGDIALQAGRDTAIGAAERQSSMQRWRGHGGHESASSVTQRGSVLAAGENIRAKADADMTVSGSSLAAGKDAALNAGNNLSIEAARESSENHLRAKGLKQNESSATASGSSVTAGGSASAQAGNNVTIIGSGFAAGDKAVLSAGRDVTIAAAENSRHYDIKAKSGGGGVFSSRSKMARTEDTDYLTSAQVSGGAGTAITAGRDVTVAASDVTAGGADNKADLSIAAGGSITARAETESRAASSSSSHANAFSKSSKKAQSYDENVIGARLGADGDVKLNAGGAATAGKDITIAGSQVLAGGNIALAGDNVTITGAAERHESKSQSRKTGFGVGSGGDFYSAYGTASKKHSQAAEVNIGSSLAAGGDVTAAARQRDVTVAGSDIAAGRDIALAAKGDVNVKTVEEHYSESSSSKRTGLGWKINHTSSSVSVGQGVNKSADKHSSQDVINAGSSLKAGRDIGLSAGHDAALTAAQLAAGRDADIAAGNNVNVLAAENEHHQQASHKESFAGITTTASSGWLATADQVTNAAERIARGGSIAGNGAIIGVNTIDNIGLPGKIKNKISEAFDKITGKKEKQLTEPVAQRQLKPAQDRLVTPPEATDGLTSENREQLKEAGEESRRKAIETVSEENKKDFFDRLADRHVSVNISAGFRESKSEFSSDSYMPVGSEISAGRAAHINANQGNIHAQGSDIKSGDIALNAGKDITIESAQERNSSHSDSKNYGGSIGYDLASGSVTGNANYGRSKSNSDSVIQHNSHLIGTGDVSIKSGGDTNIQGAQVSGKSVSADVGGNLNIESRQDTVHVRNKSDSYSIGAGADKARNTASAYNMGDWNAGYNKDRSKYDYASVTEQSGIYAGTDGFNIKVKDNTDLKGSVIASDADEFKNRLETGSLTVSDIVNYANAEAETRGFGWTGGADLLGENKRTAEAMDRDATLKGRTNSKEATERNKWIAGGDPTETGFEGKYWDGGYGAIKNGLNNLLDNGSSSKSAHGKTRTAIAKGEIIITDAAAQKERTGLTPEESIARLRRNTADTQTVAAQIDLGKLEQKAKDERAMRKGLTDEAYKVTDAVYESYSNRAADVYQVAVSKEGKALVDKNGEVIMRKLKPEEVREMVASGKLNEVQVFTNGINNDEDATAIKAVMKSADKEAPIYFVYNPYTGSGLTEVGAAIYSRVFEGNTFGLSNATKKIKEIENLYGAEGLYLYAHSRGSSTVTNSMKSQVHDYRNNPDGMKKVLSKTDIAVFGAATHAESSYKYYEDLGGVGNFGLESNTYDLVSDVFFIGNNPATFGSDPTGEHHPFRTLKEWKAIFGGGDVTAHGCYSEGAAAGCSKYGERYFKQYNLKKLEEQPHKKGGLVKESDFMNSIGQKKGTRK